MQTGKRRTRVSIFKTKHERPSKLIAHSPYSIKQIGRPLDYRYFFPVSLGIIHASLDDKNRGLSNSGRVLVDKGTSYDVPLSERRSCLPTREREQRADSTRCPRELRIPRVTSNISFVFLVCGEMCFSENCSS